MFSLLTTLYILAKGPVRCNGKKIWHTLTFYSSLPGLSLHVLRCNNIINYQTALGVFVSGTTVRMIDNMSITSLKKVVAVMTGMAKRIYDAHWHPTTTFLMVSVFFSEPVLYLIIWHKKVVILSLQLRPTWLVILPKDVPYDIFSEKRSALSPCCRLTEGNWMWKFKCI